MNALKQNYQDEVAPSLMEKFKYKSVMEVPKVEKIVVNMGVGDAVQNSKFLDNAVEELTLITGQKPVLQVLRSQSQDSDYVKECQLERK